jgi:hypothetical protein
MAVLNMMSNKNEGITVSQTYFLLFHSEHVSTQIGIISVIHEEYTNYGGIHVKTNNATRDSH